jgi:adenylate cyclase
VIASSPVGDVDVNSVLGQRAPVVPSSSESPSEYRFGAVVVRVAGREILVHGRPAGVQPKVFDLLLYLISHRDRIVDKAELLDALWPGVVVTEASLTQALKKARKLVGDDGDEQSIIRTVQRRGFRFIAPLLEARPLVSSPLESDDAVESVAVLPFRDLSPAGDQQYFCDGMVEEIINSLTRLDGLRVIARTSSFMFRGQAASAQAIGAQLGATALVDGSVQRSGDTLRVTAQLVDCSTGFQRWSGQWDRPLADVFAIQDDIAAQVAQVLSTPLSNADRASLASARPREVEAYVLYLEGLAYQRAFGRHNQRSALELFQRVIDLDPAYAPAWAGIASSQVSLYTFAEATPERLRAASEAARRAVELDPLSADAHVAVGNSASLRGDHVAAEAAYARAQVLNPQSFEAWYHHGRALASRGEHARAVEMYERAAKVRPDDYQALTFAIQSYRSLGREADALRAARVSIAAAERVLAIQPAEVRALSVTSGALVDLGRIEDAKVWTDRACALEPEEPSTQYNAACLYARLGDTERALDHLEQVRFEGMANRRWMEHDSVLDPLRGHPRFEALFGRTR